MSRRIKDIHGVIVINNANIIGVYVTQYPGTTEASALARCKRLLRKYKITCRLDGIITLGIDFCDDDKRRAGLRVAHYIERPELDV